jgi:hypothetical protein
MKKYRIDFTCLARNEDEVLKNKFAKELVDLFIANSNSKRVVECHNEFNKSIPDGHIIDSRIVESRENINGKEIFDKYIKRLFQEATLLSWDCLEEDKILDNECHNQSNELSDSDREILDRDFKNKIYAECDKEDMNRKINEHTN